MSGAKKVSLRIWRGDAKGGEFKEYQTETDEGMVLNLGPQHPATHGTLRVTAKLDGDTYTYPFGTEVIEDSR